MCHKGCGGAYDHGGSENSICATKDVGEHMIMVDPEFHMCHKGCGGAYDHGGIPILI